MLRGGLSGARWIDEADYHVTLRFAGDIDEGVARDIFYDLGRVRKPPVTLTFDGVSNFGGERPRAVIARIKPTRALLELQAEHERVMRKAGLAGETRKYTPHVTLARLRGVKSLSVAGWLGDRGFFPAREFTADQFVVYSSRDSTGGGPYVVEAAYPLMETL